MQHREIQPALRRQHHRMTKYTQSDEKYATYEYGALSVPHFSYHHRGLGIVLQLCKRGNLAVDIPWGVGDWFMKQNIF
jgi:hypothetical protein